MARSVRSDMNGEKTMQAIEVAELGGPEVLSYVETALPSPGAGEVLIALRPQRKAIVSAVPTP